LFLQVLTAILIAIVFIEAFAWGLKGVEYRRSQAIQETMDRYMQPGSNAMQDGLTDEFYEDLFSAYREADRSTPKLITPLSGIAFISALLSIGINLHSRPRNDRESSTD